MLLYELGDLSKKKPRPPKAGLRSAYTLASLDPTCGITTAMLLLGCSELLCLLATRDTLETHPHYI